MDRLTGFLTDWTTRGEKGYRVVGEQPETGRYQNSMPSKKVGRIAIFTLVALVLGFTLYSFSPVAFTSLDALHDEVHGEVEPAKQPSPVESDDWVPTGPPDIDWGFLKEQSQPHKVPSTTALGTSVSDAPDAAVDEAPPTETTPVPPSEEDFYGVPPSETPHVPGPDTDVDHSSEEVASAPSSAGPVPEADLKPQSEQDFSGGLPKEAPQDTEADSERPEAEEHEEWGEPMPEEWEEPTPPEWDEPQGSSEGKDNGESTAEEENHESEAKVEETEFEDKDAPLDWEDVPYMVEETDQLKPEDEEARSILR